MSKLLTRLILPGVCSNEILGGCSQEAEIVFERLAMAADREGRLEDRPVRLRRLLRPYRDDLDMNAVLQELADTDPPFIQRYEVGGAKYIQILKFKDHQWVYRTEVDSVIPPPPGWVATAKPKAQKEQPADDSPKTCDENLTIPYDEIIADLNEVTGQHFKATTKPFRASIRGRWEEGYRLDNFKHVHRVKWQDFLDGHFSPKEAPEKKVWLTPATLYRPGNFAKYVQQEINADKRNPDVPV